LLLQISTLYIGFCFLTGPCFTDKECRHPSTAINYGYICVLFSVVHLWIYIGGSLYTGMQELKEPLFEVTLCLKSMLTTIKFSVFVARKSDHWTIFMLAFLCVEREGFLKEMQHLGNSHSSKFIWGGEVSVLSSIIS